MTRVLVLGQAFKGSLAPADVTAALHRGADRAGVAVTGLTGSDGGDGLLDALAGQVDRTTYAIARDPLGRPVRAPIGWLDGTTAVIESRTACGLSLLTEPERDPLVTSTRGVGELVMTAVRAGARRVHVGLGGSATMDGGLGMARAWGWVPQGRSGTVLAEGGGALPDLATLKPSRPLEADVIGLYDVRNPLLGPQGAAVYARQKGADARAEERLQAGLEHLVAVTDRADLADRAGAGAAGGLGFGLLAFTRGRLEPGAPWVLTRIGFDSALDGVQGLVVAEGAFDRTSLEGKLTGEAMGRAKARGVPVVLVTPRASDVPAGVVVESRGDTWDLSTVSDHAERGVCSLLRLLDSTSDPFPPDRT